MKMKPQSKALRSRMSLAWAARGFTKTREYAIQARTRGNIEGARFWATQSRSEWETLQRLLGGAES